MTSSAFLFFFLSIAVFFVLPSSVRADPEKPNVIFILVDDMGWGDLGVFYQNDRSGSAKFSTPNLDTLAAEGMQLRSHYTTAPVCAPARASLLLGVHQGHANVRDNQFDKDLENNHTLGTVMQEAGYATANIGKWGLPGEGALLNTARPGLRGFDYFYGFLEHGDAHFHYPGDVGSYGGDAVNVYDGTTDITSGLAKCYSTDLFTARAKKWILDHNTHSPDQPFFLYLALTAPHARLDVPTQAYPAGKGEFGGLQWVGTPGAMINTASGTSNSYIHPDYSSQPGWSNDAKRHATMMRRIDDAVADIIQTLKDRGIDDDTLIVFTSDNGPHNENGKGGSYSYNPTFFDSYGPMDGIKRDSWEGGIREPALVRWPGHISANGVTHSPSQFQDWMPTLAEVAGLPSPARSDGVSLLPTLLGTGSQRESTIYVEYDVGSSTPGYSEFETSRRGRSREQEQVIQLEGYKGIRYNVTNATDDFEIYDVINDMKESNNLAGSNAFFDGLQQRMKDRVLQIRRPNSSATRPYDTALIPPVEVANTVSGLHYRAFEDEYPWVPDFVPLTSVAQGVSAGIDLSVRTRENDVGLYFTGYLDVPKDGIYTIYLQTEGHAFLRLHDASIIDADFGYTSGSEKSASVRLKAGKHPLKLGYIHGSTGTPSLSLKWSATTNPVLSKQTIPAANLLRVNSGVLGANHDAATAFSGIAKTVDVLANDVIGSGPGPLALTAVTTPAHGTANISGNEIIYTASGGYTGPDSFDYTVSDGDETADATVTVTVQAVIPPTATDDTTTAITGVAKSIAVLANDSIGSGPGPLVISSVTTPAHGSATLNGNEIIYTSSGSYTGPDSFDYTVSDGNETSDATVTITVQATAPPTATDDVVTAVTGIAKSIAVLTNDSIGSGPGPLVISSVTTPAHGTATLNRDEIIYTASGGYTGVDSFDYTVSDGNETADATVTVTVQSPNPPTANPDKVSTAPGTPVSIPVLANDSDDGLPTALSISGVSLPDGGTAVLSGDEIFYTPDSGTLGEDRFFYSITDGQESVTAQVTVTVIPATTEIWLPLDESSGTVAHDPLGRPLGVLSNFPPSPWTVGKLDGALAFDGTDAHVTLTGEKGITGTAARTVAFWLNADANQTTGARPTMVSWGADNSGSNPGTRFDINLTDSDGYRLRGEFNSSGINFTTGTRSDLRGAGWVHCAIVVPAGATVSQVLGYIDGVAATAEVYPVNSAGTAINTGAANDVTLGRIADGGTLRAYKGLLDDVRIYPRTLSAAEILLLAGQTPAHNVQGQWFFRHSGNSVPSDADWQTDSDSDGYETLLEFALGGNPTIGTEDIAPILTAGLEFIFNRRQEGLSPEDYVVEIVETLETPVWQSYGTPSVTPHPTLEGFDQVTVTLSGALGPASVSLFVRLRVER